MTVRGAIVDVDGTIVRGGEAIPGALEGIRALREAGVSVLLFSNNPTKRPAHYVDRLASVGVAVTVDDVLTSAEVSAAYLAAEWPDATLFVVGSPGLTRILAEYDLETTDDPDRAEVVVGSYDEAFDYGTLTESLYALEAADAFVGTDPDRVVPTSRRPIPGSGAIINAMAGVADREPDAILGKPSSRARHAALARLGTRPSETIVVGDRLDTDVALAREGMRSALVLTGVTSRADLEESGVRPDAVLDSLGDVGSLLN